MDYLEEFITRVLKEAKEENYWNQNNAKPGGNA